MKSVEEKLRFRHMQSNVKLETLSEQWIQCMWANYNC